jgi:CubicO group peptidase (beta-lactamase class C family)
VSKQFAAACVVLLEEQGRLSVSDPVRKWWKDTPPIWGDVTIGHLLAHSAGLPHWSRPLDVGNVPTRDDVLSQLAATPLLHPPGTRWSYSGPGYVLAATIVEFASGESYRRFVEEAIFTPLGMSKTSSGDPDDGEACARGHRDGQPLAVVTGLTDLPGTGDLWTTVGDLHCFADAYLTRGLLSERSWNLLSSLQVPIDEAAGGCVPDEIGMVTSGYGYGVYLGTISGRGILYHTGDNPGYRSLLALLPDRRTVFCSVSNEDSASMSRALHEAVVIDRGHGDQDALARCGDD